MKKTELFKSSTQNWWKISSLNKESETPKEVYSQDYTNSVNLSNYTNSSSEEMKNSVSLWDLYKSSWTTNLNIQYDEDEIYTSRDLSSNNIKILPWTTEYFGVLDIVNILWEEPQFTLEDNKWNYFAYYGNRLDFIDTVEILGGNVYEMKTEREILQNQLFGDKVSYINLSTFKDIWVLMVIEIDGEIWLLQIPTDKYHQSKDYLKSLFIH